MRLNVFFLVVGVLLLVLFSGCLNDPILIRLGGGSGSDSNKVKVSVNDSNADYLFSKLQAGSGITLAIQNSGGDENVLISAISGGSGGRTYTSGTPATIEVNNDNNTISQNFDGNFNSRINALDLNNSLNYSKVNCDNNVNCTFTGKITTTRDANFLNIRFNGTLSGGDFNYSLADANMSQSCPAGQALQSVGNVTSCVSVTSSGSGRTYTSGTPATIEVNNDLNTISQNFDGNFSIRFRLAFDTNFLRSFDTNFVRAFDSNFLKSFDSNFTKSFDSNFLKSFDSNFQKSFDGNFQRSFDANYYSRNALLFPVPDANILNSALYKANCDNNTLCTFTGKITTVLDANFRNIQFNGTLSGGDFNYSLGDANGSQSCPAGQALQSVGSITSCIVIPSTTGRTYTSGTPGTIEVNNDLNTISQNFDGNFILRFDSNFNTKFPVSFDSNFYTKFKSVFDSNFNSRINGLDLNNSLNYLKTSSDGNGSILGTTNQVNVTNGLSRLFKDSNVVLSLPQNIDSSASPTFVGMTFSPCGTIVADVSPQVRFKIDCSANLVTSTTFIPAQPGITDIGNATNRWDDLTISDINATGDTRIHTLTADDNAVFLKNVRFNATLSGGDFNQSILDHNDSFSCPAGQAIQTIGNTTACVAVSSSGTCDNNASCTITGTINTNIDANFNDDVNIQGNTIIDGNLFAKDENTFVGNPATGFNDDIIFYGSKIVTNPGSGGPDMIIGADTFAFCATPCTSGSESGIKFSATAPRGIKVFSAGALAFLFGAGAPGVESVLGYGATRTTNPSGTGLANGWTFWKDNGTVDMNWQWNVRRNGIFQHFNAQMFLGIANDNTFDANWNGDVNYSGDFNISNSLDVDQNSWFHENVFVDKNIYGQLISPGTAVGTSCNTVCGGVNYGGPWTCVEALSTAGVASTCADITVAKTCLCRN